MNLSNTSALCETNDQTLYVHKAEIMEVKRKGTQTVQGTQLLKRFGIPTTLF